MSRSKVKSTVSPLDRLLGEASWLLSHAESLADYGRKDEATAELARAASCEEEVASLLDAAEREAEAAVHRVSAASCYEQLGQFSRAVTLLRAALSGPIRPEYRRKIERQLTHCLAHAHKELSRV